MFEIQPLRPDHAEPVLAFERANRAYFAATVPDRTDAYFAEYPARYAALLAEQEAGVCRFHVAVAADGTVIARVNLVDIADNGAELGFRVAQRVAGRGVATRAVARVCETASGDYGLTRLFAATTVTNRGSQAVLTANAFTVTGKTELAGKPALTYIRHLA